MVARRALGRFGVYGESPRCLWPPVLTVRGHVCLLQGPAPAWGCWVCPLPTAADCSELCCYHVGPTSLGAFRGHRVWLIP